jgi:hypothetical protein
MTDRLQWSSREHRLAKLADEHQVAVRPGSGRFAAIIERCDGPRLAQADAIDELFALGDVRALVNLDCAPSTRDR